MLNAIQFQSLFSLVQGYVAENRQRVLGLLLLTVMVSVLEGAGLLMLAPMLQMAGVGGTDLAGGGYLNALFKGLGIRPTLAATLLLYIGLIVVHSLLFWQLRVLSDRSVLEFIDRLRQRLYDAIGAAEWSFLSGTHHAQFTHALTSDIGRLQSAIDSFWQFFTITAIALGYTLVAIVLSPMLTLMTMGVGLLLMLFLGRFQRDAYQLGQKLSDTSQRVQQNIEEYLSGLKLAKSGNAEKRLSAHFSKDITDVRIGTMNFIARHSAALGIFRVGGAMALCTFIYVALMILSVPAATVLALAFIFMRLLPYLSDIQQSLGRVLHDLPAYENFQSMYDECLRSSELPASQSPYTLQREIALSNVCYCPSGETGGIIRNLSFRIPARGTTALVGPSGAGKSTLADLLAGLLEVSEGSIIVDGRPLSDRRRWRECVAYVPQETFLFNASVRENLLWLTPEASDDMLWDVLDQAAAAEFVRCLPDGLGTVLGENGIRLSGGERQRLAIARALLKNPTLLILDEATSALDRDNEQHIQTTLSRLHHQLTILLIAHRPATIECADQVVMVSDGQLVSVRAQTPADSVVNPGSVL